MRHAGQHGVHQTFIAIVLSMLAAGPKAAEQATSFTLPLASLPDGYSRAVGDWSTGYCGKHLGQDIPVPANTPVYAIANGIVKYSEDIDGLGHAIHIEHDLPDGSQLVSVYYHLVREGVGGISFFPNTEVTVGQLIARTTSYPPDYGTGPHLHFAIRPGPYAHGPDSRTNKWFYPGYTSIYTRRSGANVRECDQVDARHDEIVTEWILDPIQYVKDKTTSPPSPPGEEIAGLVAYYPFNGSANDVSGNGKDGLIYGGVTLSTDRFGKTNSAYSLDGVTGYILVQSSQFSTDITNAMTASFWIKTSSEGYVGQSILSLTNNSIYGGSQEYRFMWEGGNFGSIGTLGFSKYVGQGGIVTYLRDSIADNRWHHIVGVADTSTMKVYRDGILVGTSSWAQFPTNMSYLVIGRRQNMYKQAEVDDVRIYNRALSDQEVTYLHGLESSSGGTQP